MFATRHASLRVEQRLGFVPDDEDWVGVVLAITDRAMTSALKLRQAGEAEVWLVRMRDVAAKVVWNPATAVVITVLPAGRE